MVEVALIVLIVLAVLWAVNSFLTIPAPGKIVINWVVIGLLVLWLLIRIFNSQFLHL